MTRVVLPALILVSAVAVVGYSSRDLLRPAVPVRVAVVIPRDGAAGVPTPGGERNVAIVQAPGWVEPAPYAVTVPALAEGVVREVLVLEGERVEAGQVVARLIDDEARLAARTAEALVAEREAAVELARAAVATAEMHAHVERAAREELREEIERKRGLIEAGAVSPGELRRLEIRLSGLEARSAAAERAVDEARAALVLAQAALATARLERDSAILRLDRMEIRSPSSGVVLSRLVWPGVHVSTGSMREGDMGHAGGVLRLYDPASLQVRVDVPLADAAKVGLGCRAVVTSEALPDTPIAGMVTRVVHEANIQRNTVQFKVALEDPPAVLKPEMLVRVRLFGSGQVGEGAAGAARPIDAILLVPARAIQPAAMGKGVVWVIDVISGRTVVRRREVEVTSWTDPEHVAVTSGLRMTDRVIVDPPGTLTDGARVRVVPDAAPPPVRGTEG